MVTGGVENIGWVPDDLDAFDVDLGGGNDGESSPVRGAVRPRSRGGRPARGLSVTTIPTPERDRHDRHDDEQHRGDSAEGRHCPTVLALWMWTLTGPWGERRPVHRGL